MLMLRGFFVRMAVKQPLLPKRTLAVIIGGLLVDAPQPTDQRRKRGASILGCKTDRQMGEVFTGIAHSSDKFFIKPGLAAAWRTEHQHRTRHFVFACAVNR